MTNNWAPEETAAPAATPPRTLRPGAWRTWAILAIALLIGVYFRTLNLTGWDGASYLHPDERFIIFTVNGLHVPRSFGEYLTSACLNNEGQVVKPRNPQDSPDQQEPTRESGCNTLNPRNYNWSRFFVYGTLPTTLTRVVAEVRRTLDAEEIRNTGRMLSTLWDLGSIVMVFLIGRRLYDRRVGLLAALLLAMAVLPIQLAHFFTVDSATAFFTLLTIYWCIRVAQGGGVGSFAGMGLSIGAAMACRATLATLALIAIMAVVQRVWWYQEPRATQRVPDQEPWARIPTIVWDAGAGRGAGAVGLPDAPAGCLCRFALRRTVYPRAGPDLPPAS